MTTNHTAPDLLEAVGVDWKANWSRLKCPECSTSDARLYHNNNCRRPYTCDLPLTYTGPALGTPELDRILLAAGVKRLREVSRDRLFTILGKLPDHEFHNAALTLLLHDTPGHALARAIREVQG